MIRQSTFRPAWWLNNRHAQTLWPVWFRSRRVAELVRERLELPDGDFVDLDWGPSRRGPVTLIFHGLEGSSRSHYAAGLLGALSLSGFQGVVAHFRGCSGEPNRHARSYTAGETGDIDHIVRRIRNRCPDRELNVIGYSLGGNALLKWLARSSAGPDLVHRAAAVSVPFELSLAADRLETGFSRIYQGYLLRKLRRSTLRKTGMQDFPLSSQEISACTSLRDFDDTVTAPLHGYRNVREYYATASSRQYLREVRVPTLILHALDDPFMTRHAVPDESDLSPHIVLELSQTGGHVGFVSGRFPWRPQYWIDQRLILWLCEPAQGLEG